MLRDYHTYLLFKVTQHNSTLYANIDSNQLLVIYMFTIMF